MKVKKKFVLTAHVRERYLERIKEIRKYKPLSECFEEDCYECKKLKRTLELEVYNNKRQLDEEIKERLNRATSEKSYLNNSSFMYSIYKKYGYDRRFELLLDKDVVFIVILDEANVVVTCMNSSTTILANYACKNRVI